LERNRKFVLQKLITFVGFILGLLLLTFDKFNDVLTVLSIIWLAIALYTSFKWKIPIFVGGRLVTRKNIEERYDDTTKFGNFIVVILLIYCIYIKAFG